MTNKTALGLTLAALLSGSLAAACEPPEADDDLAGSSSGAAACSTEGTGTIVVDVVGLPAGVEGAVRVDGPDSSDRTLAVSTTLAASAAGTYTVSATSDVVVADPVVRSVYRPVVSGGEFCLAADATQTATVQYAPVATSNRLWVTQSNADAQLVGVPSSDLRASGTAASAVAAEGPAGRSGAFDKDGNFWTTGATADGANLQRFAAGSLATAGAPVPDRKLTVDFGGCVPAVGDVAFDPAGNLWVASPCGRSVSRIPATALAATGAPVVDVKISGAFTEGVTGIAFDAAGNLWAGSGTSLLRYDAARLGVSSTEAPSRSLVVQRAEASPLSPGRLAFDAGGNLWVSDFGGNVLAKLDTAQLAGGAATEEPSVSLVLAVDVLLTSLAFDESGGLWVPYGRERIGRIDPAQLTVSTDPGSPTTPSTVVSSASFGALEWLGFYPGPTGTPLDVRSR